MTPIEAYYYFIDYLAIWVGFLLSWIPISWISYQIGRKFKHSEYKDAIKFDMCRKCMSRRNRQLEEWYEEQELINYMKQKILTEQDRMGFIEWFNKIKLDKPYIVECKQYRKRRTLPQNALYWAWVHCIAHETGNDADSIHSYLRKKFLGLVQYGVFGECKVRLKSTTELNKKQFTDYMNAIDADVSTEGIKLLRPEDKNFEAFYEQYKDMIN